MFEVIQLFLLVGFFSLSAAFGHGAFMGGITPMHEDEFLNPENFGFDFKLLINNLFVNDVKGSNQMPMSYFRYICGTRQVSITV